MSTNFLPQAADSQNSQMALVLAAQVTAEIQAACVMARNDQRDWDVVRERLLKECKRSSFAEVALYLKPVGKGVEGFSIRFAEAAMQASKHIHITVRTIWEDEEQRKMLVKVWDAQEMVSYADEISIEKTVERRSIQQGQEVIRTRKNKNGDLLYIVAATEDDLLNKVNAAKSKSIRTNGLRLIPGWIKDQALHAIKETLKTSDEKNPDSAKQNLFDKFGELGVMVEQIKRFLGHEAVTLTPRELQELRALYASIKEGETTMHAVLASLEKETAEAEDPPAAGPSGVAAPKTTTQSVKDKILERARRAGTAGGTAVPAAGAQPVGEVLPKTAEGMKTVIDNLQAKAGEHPGRTIEGEKGKW